MIRLLSNSLAVVLIVGVAFGASQRANLQTEPDGTTALHAAVLRNDTATVDVLLRTGANARAVTRYGVTPLYLACVNGNEAIIEKLLAKGADPNTALPEGETALMTAARTGSVPAIKALLSHGANVNANEGWKGQTALMWAVAENNAEAAKVLIDAGADIKASTRRVFSSTPALISTKPCPTAPARSSWPS